MNPFIDGVMIFLFILFMVFIFGGYHKNKSAQREEEFKIEEAKELKDKL
jgi:Ca2+/Na+ antiporter